MGELKDLVGLGDSRSFPRYILSPPRLLEFAEAEEEAACQYLRGIARASLNLPASLRDALHQRAVDNLRAHPFSYGSAAFDQWALSMSAAPFLAWLCLRIAQPRLTLNEASQLLSGGDYVAKVAAVWTLWGYKPAKKASSPVKTNPPVKASSPAIDPLQSEFAGGKPSTGSESSIASPADHHGAAD